MESTITVCTQIINRRSELQQHIADRAAIGEIESFCARRYDHADQCYWYDIASADHIAKGWVDEAVEYLSLRNLIQRDQNEVRFLVNVAEVA